MTKRNTLEASLKQAVRKHLEIQTAAVDINSAAKIIQGCFSNNRIKAKVTVEPRGMEGMIQASVTDKGFEYVVVFELDKTGGISVDFSDAVDQYQSALRKAAYAADANTISKLSLYAQKAKNGAVRFQNVAIKELSWGRKMMDDAYEGWLNLLGVIIEIGSKMGK